MDKIITNIDSSGELDYVTSIRDKMKAHKFLLIYEGTFSQSLIKAVLALTEKKMEHEGESRGIKRKVFNVMVECLQNISKHGEAVERINQSIFMIGQTEEGYNVSTGNPILQDEVDSLENKLLAINNMDTDELKDLYKSLMAYGDYSEKAGAGLGLIDIARKSGSKLNYQFFDLSEDKQFFAMSTKIMRKK